MSRTTFFCQRKPDSGRLTITKGEFIQGRRGGGGIRRRDGQVQDLSRTLRWLQWRARGWNFRRLANAYEVRERVIFPCSTTGSSKAHAVKVLCSTPYQSGRTAERSRGGYDVRGSYRAGMNVTGHLSPNRTVFPQPPAQSDNPVQANADHTANVDLENRELGDCNEIPEVPSLRPKSRLSVPYQPSTRLTVQNTEQDRRTMVLPLWTLPLHSGVRAWPLVCDLPPTRPTSLWLTRAFIELFNRRATLESGEPCAKLARDVESSSQAGCSAHDVVFEVGKWYYDYFLRPSAFGFSPTPFAVSVSSQIGHPP